MSLGETLRQKYFDEVSYLPTLQVFDENKTAYAETLGAPPSHAHASALHYRALDLWDTFQLSYTAGKAEFWGAHKRITPEFSPYFGYWAMCAGAFTYLLGLDDGSYRDEEVYPKDMVDYARSLSRRAVKLSDGREILRVEGGQPCPSKGVWFGPAKSEDSRYFKTGEVMPVLEASEYGHTIWQRADENLNSEKEEFVNHLLWS